MDVGGLEASGMVYLLGEEASLEAVAPVLTAFAQDTLDTATHRDTCS